MSSYQYSGPHVKDKSRDRFTFDKGIHTWREGNYTETGPWDHQATIDHFGYSQWVYEKGDMRKELDTASAYWQIANAKQHNWYVVM